MVENPKMFQLEFAQKFHAIGDISDKLLGVKGSRTLAPSILGRFQ